MAERTREVDIFLPLVHSTSGKRCQGWIRLKPGMRSPLQHSHIGGSSADVLALFPITLSGSWFRNKWLELESEL